MMQPSLYTLENISIESVDAFSSTGLLAMLVDYEPMVARHENGSSYKVGLRLAIKDRPDEPTSIPYRITCEGWCAFESEGYSAENDTWVLSEGLRILYGLISGSIGAITGQFKNGPYVPPVFDMSEKSERLLERLSKTGK
jgi:hypothetical protein